MARPPRALKNVTESQECNTPRTHRTCTPHINAHPARNRSPSTANGFSKEWLPPHARRYLSYFLMGQAGYIRTVDGRRSSTCRSVHHTARNILHREYILPRGIFYREGITYREGYYCREDY